VRMLGGLPGAGPTIASGSTREDANGPFIRNHAPESASTCRRRGYCLVWMATMMARSRPGLLLVALAAAPFASSVGACGELSPAGEARGGACSSDRPCLGWLICVDGTCLERAEAETPLPPWSADALPDPTDVPDADHVRDAGDADTALADVSDTASGADAGPVDVGADADAALDPDGDTSSTEDGAGDTVGPALLVLGDHDAQDNPSSVVITFAPDQGVVQELVTLTPARAVSLEAIATTQANATGSACGRYRPTLWLPDDGGAFPTAPAASGETHELVATGQPVEIPLPDWEIPAGPVRVGLVFEGLCPSSPWQPLLALDASGEIAGTWVWVRIPTGGAWVAAQDLSLDGRWALRLTVRVP